MSNTLIGSQQGPNSNSDSFRLPLCYESPSGNLISAANQSFTNEDGTSVSSQTSGSPTNATTNKILLATLAVNAALCIGFICVFALELSLKLSQPAEERGDTDAFRRAQESAWKTQTQVFEANRQTEKAKNAQPGFTMRGNQEIAARLQPAPGKTLASTPLFAWLRDVVGVRTIEGGERLDHGERSAKLADDKYTLDFAKDPAIASLFEMPEVRGAFHLAAVRASQDDVDTAARDIGGVSKEQFKNHVSAFKHFFAGAAR
jgi:hypothetical protein